MKYVVFTSTGIQTGTDGEPILYNTVEEAENAAGPNDSIMPVYPTE